MVLRAVVFMILLLIPVGTQQAIATTINFDTFPDDGTVPQAQDRITTEYASCGVAEFTTSGTEGPKIWDFNFVGKSPPNHIAVSDSSLDSSDQFLGSIGVEFVSPVSSASIVALGVGRCGLALEGFNSAGALVAGPDSVSHSSTGSVNVDVLSISGLDIIRLNIRQLTPLSSCSTGEIDGYTIDDLVFPGPVCEFQETQVIGGEIIPIETTSLLLAGMQTNFSILTILGMVGAGAFGTLYYISKRK